MLYAVKYWQMTVRGPASFAGILKQDTYLSIQTYRVYFQRKLNELTEQNKKVVEVYRTVNMKATEDSYRVALHIAKAGKKTT